MDYNTAKQVIEEIYDWLGEIEFTIDDTHCGILDNTITSAGHWYANIMEEVAEETYRTRDVIKLFDLDAYMVDDETGETVFTFTDFVAFGDVNNGHLVVTADIDEIIPEVASLLVCIFDKLNYKRIR